MNLCKRKWLIASLYNPHKTTISSYLKDIEKEIDSLLSQCENIILQGDFNCELKEETLSTFCEVHNLKNLIKEPTCFKNPEKPTIIDLIWSNNLRLSLEVDDPSKYALKDFQNVCLTSLNSFAPLKKKYVKANQALFMNKELKKAIMIRSKLRNKFLKSSSEEDKSIQQTEKYVH